MLTATDFIVIIYYPKSHLFVLGHFKPKKQGNTLNMVTLRSTSKSYFLVQKAKAMTVKPYRPQNAGTQMHFE
jgi:hypothetical protein